MLLEDTILIKAPAAKLFRFFEQMDRNYTAWHPQHLHFEWRRGAGLQPGTTFYFEENIAGEHQKKEVVVTAAEKDRYFAFAPVNRFFRLFLPKLSFAFCEQADGTWFTATVALRLGPLAAWLHREELAQVRAHMREEGENLKTLMEAVQPPKTPIR